MTTNKTLLSAFALLALIFTSCTVDGKDSTDPKPEIETDFLPNADVLRAFDIKFPNARNTVWTTNNSYYVADFTENGSTVNAWFDQKSTWYLTKSSVSSSSLPKDVSATFSKSSYATWNVSTTNILERKDMGSIYVVGASNDVEDVNLYYSKYGDLIKAVGNAKTYVDKPVTVPAEVSTLISNIFTGPQIIDMWNDATGIKVCVIDNNEYKIAALDSDYDWICTIINLTEELVPERVLDSFQSSEYGVYHIDDIKQMTNNEDISYLFYFKNIDKNKNAVATLKESGSFKSVLSY